MFYKVTVYQIVDFYLIATSADPVLSFLCGDKSELHPLRSLVTSVSGHFGLFLKVLSDQGPN